MKINGQMETTAETVDEELAQKLGVEPQMVQMLKIRAQSPISLQAKVGDDEGADFGDFVADAKSSDPAAAADQKLLHERLIYRKRVLIV